MAVEQNEIQFLTDDLHFPRTALNQNKFLSKENLIKLGHLDTKQRDILVRAVKQVNWLFLMTEANTNISAYRGSDININEIDYFIVELKSESQANTVAKLILQIIPKASIVQLTWEDDNQQRWYEIGMADYTMMRGKSNLLSMGGVHISEPTNVREEFVRYFDFQSQIKLNLKAMYASFVDNLERYNFEKSVNVTVGEHADFSALNVTRKKLNKQIEQLTRVAKKEQQISKRSRYSAQIKKLRQELSDIENVGSDNPLEKS
ncbi:DUF4391 family protein [Weissella confusa]|uniref:DUF4391 domain-containing protein n=1 Tax=Weissella confusa TaxID=1583 RepID=UPI0021C0C717|nr:DUF4391 domain-containing protein [Weissella confusa]MCT8392978.1 DUF4391 family protein [Weissella confusa]